jgi:hypothetical protein
VSWFGYCIVLNLWAKNFLLSLPHLSCLKNTGPGELSFINTAIKGNNHQEIKSRKNRLTITSKLLLKAIQ